MSFQDLIKERYSCRKYSTKEVEKEKLDAILQAGNVAPTAKNLQPQRIYVLQSKEALERLSKVTFCGYGAKTVLLFAYNSDEDWKNPLQEGVHSGVEDVSIVATHIMLEATEQGLATCWCNYFPNREVEKAFSLGDNEHVVLIMPVGYAAEDAKPSAMHSEKKALASTVKYL